MFNHFSLNINANHFFNPFIFYYDLIGPGTRMPLGAGLNYFFPTALFIKNIPLFYFSSILLSFYLVLNYLKKILKLFKINDYIKKKLKIEGAHIDQFYSAFYYALSKNKIYRKNKNLRNQI